MKDGEYVDTVLSTEIDNISLVNKMVGRDMTEMFPKRDVKVGDIAFEASNVNAGPQVKDISFKVRKGEVLGFAGLVGSGRTETMRAIFGADPMQSGEIIYFGEPVKFKSPKKAVKKGFGLLPEDRKQQGVLLEQSIRMNSTLSAMQHAKNSAGLLDVKKERKFVKDILAQLSTKYNSTEDNVSSLSGGNQQKVSLSKWLAADCKVIVLDEPTRGVDVGAKVEIYNNINDLAAQGTAIIMISSEMPELIGMCDRIIVMRHGQIAGELAKKDITENNLVALEMGVVK
jgi:ribose transport system ATP-binding protein